MNLRTRATAVGCALAVTAVVTVSAAAPAAADVVVDKDEVKITQGDFKLVNPNSSGGAITHPAEVHWWLAGAGDPHAALWGTLIINNAAGKCARIVLNSLDGSTLLHSRVGATHCASTNQTWLFNVHLKSPDWVLGIDGFDRVRVRLQVLKNNGDWESLETQDVWLGD